MPSNRPQVTKAPTARKATSLTTDSKAMAATIPSCRSALSRCRVPNTMVKAASASATKSVPSRHQATPAPRALRAGGEQVVAGGHRLQLQRDVRDDADDGDQCDQRGQQRALAIAAGDEVGDRGDPVGLRDADHLAHHDPGQQHRQHRPEVDRQEPDAGRRRAPDAAEVGPGGAVDRQRQRIDPGVADHRAARRRAPVAEGGDREQQQQVAEGDAENQRRRDHRSAEPPPQHLSTSPLSRTYRNYNQPELAEASGHPREVRAGLEHGVEGDEKLAGGGDDRTASTALPDFSESVSEGPEGRDRSARPAAPRCRAASAARSAAADASDAALWPLSRATGARPASAAIQRRSRGPSSAAPARMSLPRPGRPRARAQPALGLGQFRIGARRSAAISASKAAISTSRARMWRVIERARRPSFGVCWSRVASCLRISTSCRRRVASAWSARRAARAARSGARSSRFPISARSALDPVGLGESSRRAGELPRLGRIDARMGRAAPRAPGAAAGRSRRSPRRRRTPRPSPLPLRSGRSAARLHLDPPAPPPCVLGVDPVLGDIDADDILCHDLSCPCACGSALNSPNQLCRLTIERQAAPWPICGSDTQGRERMPSATLRIPQKHNTGRACLPLASAIPRPPVRRGPLTIGGPGRTPLALRHPLPATHRAGRHWRPAPPSLSSLSPREPYPQSSHSPLP